MAIRLVEHKITSGRLHCDRLSQGTLTPALSRWETGKKERTLIPALSRWDTKQSTTLKTVQFFCRSTILVGVKSARGCVGWTQPKRGEGSIVPQRTELRMAFLTSATLDRLRDDFDAREETLEAGRRRPAGRTPAPACPTTSWRPITSHFRSGTLEHAVEEISYHATSGVKNPPAGSLLAQCSAQQAGVDAFDASGRIGLLARRVSAQDDAAPERAPHLVRPAAHHRRRGHLRRLREPGRPADLDPDSRRRARRLPRARPTGRSTSARRRASPSTSPRSARS